LGLSQCKKWKLNVSKLSNYTHEKTFDFLKFAEEDEYNLIKEHGLMISENGLKECKYYIPIINFPDISSRIYRNYPSIYWINDTLVGVQRTNQIPYKEPYLIYNHQNISKVRKNYENTNATIN